MPLSPDTPGTVILRDSPPTGEPRWLAFSDPERILTARTVAEVEPLLRRVEAGVGAGLFAAGYIAYEAAPACDPACRTQPPPVTPTALPLVWFGLYRRAERLDALPPGAARPPTLLWTPSESPAVYASRIDRIRAHIAEGDTYQVNYTFRLSAPFDGDPWPLFLALAAAQQSRYAAWIRLDGHTLCSASPELFFRLDGDHVLCRPMKGTAIRGLTPATDRAARAALRNSPKNRAENVMIVDMIRNDLGRVAIPGTVRVPRRFTVEPYPTVWQMTSDVEARTDAGLADLLAALFPCASITGAPKIRALDLIATLESSPRGVYTGAIGYVAPGRRAQFSVAIRTVAVNHAAATAEYGTGGGIVWDSSASSEYAEALAKTRILDAPPADLCLLETVLWRPKRGFFLLRSHLRRLVASARLLGFPCDTSTVLRCLNAAVANADTSLRVRLLIPRAGPPVVETAPAPPPVGRPWRIALAAQPIDPDLTLLRHKTTCRTLYDNARVNLPEADDVLLWNTRSEITETTVANIALCNKGRWFTPPLASGLLPGVFRDRLLRTGRITERTLTRDDLRTTDGIALFNSLRGWIPAELIEPWNNRSHHKHEGDE
ncbi:MAG: aminodeoxychorismate synthase component I [Lentisphaerae bacterium]|nr:aminodeoxychorismate synthase component I [Lentisphaerota bacterium]